LKINSACVLFTALFLISSCTKIEDQDSSGTASNAYPDQESWNAKMYFTRDGKRQAVLTAGYIAKYSSQHYTLLKEAVRVDFYDSEGKVKSVLTSREGKVLDETQDMIASGDVELVSNNGTHLYADELFWDNKPAKIRSRVPVKITTKTDTLFGDTFLSDSDLDDYEITNPHGSSQKTINIHE
jgi:LPS export ABC transporter protein LptC